MRSHGDDPSRSRRSRSPARLFRAVTGLWCSPLLISAAIVAAVAAVIELTPPGETLLPWLPGSFAMIEVAIGAISVGAAWSLQRLIVRPKPVPSEAQQKQAAWLAGEGRFHELLDRSQVMVWVTSPTSECTFFNRTWLEFRGRTLEQETGDGWKEGVHPDDYARSHEIFVRSFAARREFTMEYRLKRADGEYRWVIDSGKPVFLPDGSFEGFCGSSVDVTDLRRSEQALDDSEQEFRTLFETSLVGQAQSTLDARFVKVNEALCRLIGYSAEELVGMTFRDITHPDDIEEGIENSRRLLSGEITESIQEKRYVRKDGTSIWVLVNVSLIRDREGRAVRFNAVVTDVSARRAAEDELRRSNKRLEELVLRERTLMRELDHRVRNMLAGLLGLIKLHERSGISGAEMASELSAKVRALNDTHDLIAVHPDRPILIADLVRRLAVGLVHHDAAAQVDADGDHVSVAPSQAQALAMTLQELFTNARKHGALSGRPGSIRLRWSRAADSLSGFVIDWDEQITPGNPAPDTQVRSSVGLRLIEGLARTELQGDCTLSFSPGRFKARIGVNVRASTIPQAAAPLPTP